LEDKAAREAAPPFPPTVMVQVVVRLIPSHRLMPAAMELPPHLSASFPCSEDLGRRRIRQWWRFWRVWRRRRRSDRHRLLIEYYREWNDSSSGRRWERVFWRWKWRSNPTRRPTNYWHRNPQCERGNRWWTQSWPYSSGGLHIGVRWDQHPDFGALNLDCSGTSDRFEHTGPHQLADTHHHFGRRGSGPDDPRRLLRDSRCVVTVGHDQSGLGHADRRQHPGGHGLHGEALAAVWGGDECQ